MDRTLIVLLGFWVITIIIMPITYLVNKGMRQHLWLLGFKQSIEYLSYIAWMMFYFATSNFLIWASLCLYIYVSYIVPNLPGWILTSLAVSSVIATLGISVLIITRIRIWIPKYSEMEKDILKREQLQFNWKHPRIAGLVTRLHTFANKI